MQEYIMFYDSKGNELAGYTKKDTFAGELAETKALLAYERGIPENEITIKEVKR